MALHNFVLFYTLCICVCVHASLLLSRYFGKLVGKKPPGRGRSESESSVSSCGGGSGGGDTADGDFLAEYAKTYGNVFITEEENAAVEIDHRMIHSVVNEAPVYSTAMRGEREALSSQNNNSDVRLFSWYMHVIMHNSRCMMEKLKSIKRIHARLDASKDKDTDKHCLCEYVIVGKEVMDNVVSTTQIAKRSAAHLGSVGTVYYSF